MSLNEDSFDKKYSPDENLGQKSKCFNDGKFETFGDDLSFIKEFAKENRNRLWTYVEGDRGLYIVAGYRQVNRLCYLITCEPWESEDEEYLVGDVKE